MIAEEASSPMEPARIEHPSSELLDLSIDIVARAERLGAALHPETAAQLARTVRIMNTYYSNLIEGHNTRPREIEQAAAGTLPDPASEMFIQNLHRTFYEVPRRKC